MPNLTDHPDAALLDRLNRRRTDSESWRPEPGDVVVGNVIELAEHDGSTGRIRSS